MINPVEAGATCAVKEYGACGFIGAARRTFILQAILKAKSSPALGIRASGTRLEVRERDFFKNQILVHAQHLFSIEVNGHDDDGEQKRKPSGSPWVQK
jgi:hypothetical protein